MEDKEKIRKLMGLTGKAEIEVGQSHNQGIIKKKHISMSYVKIPKFNSKTDLNDFKRSNLMEEND